MGVVLGLAAFKLCHSPGPRYADSRAGSRHVAARGNVLVLERHPHPHTMLKSAFLLAATLISLTPAAIAQLHPLDHLREYHTASLTDGVLSEPSAGYTLVLATEWCIAPAHAWPGYEGAGAWIAPYEHGPDWQGVGRASCQWSQVEYFTADVLEAAGVPWQSGLSPTD